MTRRDLARVAAIELNVFGRDAWPLHAFRDLLAAFSQARPVRGAMWVAEDPRTGELLGYAGVEVSALWGEMDVINIAVAAEYRRRGVPLLWLRVRASNRGARRFYRRMGFRERGRFQRYYEDPAEPAVIMAMDV
jgi:ribosomal protein S18 acetylase RimI-like enzyme